MKKIVLLTFLIMSLAGRVSAGNFSVWQGQYYKGTEMQVGAFNFTVYASKNGGSSCYTNHTTLTTGNFGISSASCVLEITGGIITGCT